MTDIALSYAQTVDRRLTHRAAVSECFVTDAVSTGERTFLVAAQLPRTHSYYNDHVTSSKAPAAYDPLLVLEIFRQTCIVASHEYMAVPEGSSFVFDRGDMEILDSHALHLGDLPGRMVVAGEITEIRERAGIPAGATIEVRASVDNREAASMRLVFRWMPRETWQRLRKRARTALTLTPQRAHALTGRLKPAAVGRRLPSNVVLGGVTVVLGQEVVAPVVVDQRHPALFDHPVDHIPGAVMFEAFRQTALTAAHELLGLPPQQLTMSTCEVEFSRVGEFELPTDCRAQLTEETDGHYTFGLVLEQEGEVIARSRVTLTAVGLPARRNEDRAPSTSRGELAPAAA
ncbi:ScbA/BarX family gamma-butyrolactone biosynthesis protein [Streptomyces indicus]|uniref:A-factor biosynthesis hotdog domain-containing protein n=1 Tax=Streptomyces indicus TaxID=417292 RepID=A0A1G9HNN9_9ACTN|nr:ScbA/BarX family gamma-butyrolactone biosynthesis protein [Streptomyces indicus]SDL14578.1 A-factor biosynthesis hotdog domain-containing protein [Streptomyces indicus]